MERGLTQGSVDQNAFFFFPLPFCFVFNVYVCVCVCALNSRSSVKENKLNIFKTDKSVWGGVKKNKNKSIYIILFNVYGNTVLMMLNFLDAPSSTRHEEQKVYVKSS